MSLILDALNRSRQDAAGVPDLASAHFGEGAGKGRNWLQWLLVAALGLAVVTIGWLLFDRLQPSPAAPLTAGLITTPVAPQPSPPVAPEPAAVEPAAVEPAAVEPAAVEPAAVEPAAVEPAAVEPAAVEPAAPSVAPSVDRRDTPPAPAAPALDTGPARVDDTVAALYRQREEQAVAAVDAAPENPPPTAQTALAPAVQEEPLDIEQLVAKAQADLRDARLAEHGVPLISSLSQQTKDTIPTVMYQRHDYSGIASQSSVVINGKSLRAGMSAGGFEVEEILPDSVVLNYRGTRFRLRALNSWVNL